MNKQTEALKMAIEDKYIKIDVLFGDDYLFPVRIKRTADKKYQLQVSELTDLFVKAKHILGDKHEKHQ